MSEQVESSNGENNSASEADAESHDEIQTGGLNDADAAAAHQTDSNLPVFDQVYGSQGSWTFTTISFYQHVENLILYILLFKVFLYLYYLFSNSYLCSWGGS